VARAAQAAAWVAPAVLVVSVVAAAWAAGSGARRSVARSGEAVSHQRDRAVIALCRRRLSGRLGARLSWVLGLGVTLVALGLVLAGGESLGTRELLLRAVRWMAWLAVPPIALAAAGSPVERDRGDGVDVLVRIHGVSSRRLGMARGVAAMVEVAFRVALPAWTLCVLVAVLTPAWSLLAMLPGLLLFAGWAGLVLGGLGAACGHFGGTRGRSLLLVVVLAPWVVADGWGLPQLSIPGAMDLMLTLFADVASLVARVP
jgi:hypothetical protein